MQENKQQPEDQKGFQEKVMPDNDMMKKEEKMRRKRTVILKDRTKIRTSRTSSISYSRNRNRGQQEE